MTAEKKIDGIKEKVACKFCGKDSSVEKEFLIHHVLTVHPNEPEVKEWLEGLKKVLGGASNMTAEKTEEIDE